ncbi:unnamed protein product [Angiostrongylus costaricensis]|uniref:Uncharacterized protein n=1 Tax=Angiostrongylus costaricensis TaxID=334426 RepID=A0A0R3PQV9_ANGCS|nr:unnamed protein product [Angiostrongylus costaricensis]
MRVKSKGGVILVPQAEESTDSCDMRRRRLNTSLVPARPAMIGGIFSEEAIDETPLKETEIYGLCFFL